MRKELKEYPKSICHTCLVRAACKKMCYKQAEQMKNNVDVYFVGEIANIIKNSTQDSIQLIISAENTYELIRTKKEDEYG